MNRREVGASSEIHFKIFSSQSYMQTRERPMMWCNDVNETKKKSGVKSEEDPSR